jgi:hypothetical protein
VQVPEINFGFYTSVFQNVKMRLFQLK